MGDFYQGGMVATLHNLVDRPLEDLEADLIDFSKSRPMSLVLPSLFSELQGQALEDIVQNLRDVPYLSEIVIGLDRANANEFREAVNYFGRLPQHHRILWNDGPRLRAIDQRLQAEGLAPQEPGKGRNAWYCLGYVLASGRGKAIALHDCDITTYSREMLARLVYPVAN
ncbi:MAG: glycosyl transferase, partial [Spongiibacteraceae bacterium]|nr:glycosyl transferase [Spongiibacteraceae bacterium]